MAFAIHTIDKPDALFARLANYDGRRGAFCRTQRHTAFASRRQSASTRRAMMYRQSQASASDPFHGKILGKMNEAGFGPVVVSLRKSAIDNRAAASFASHAPVGPTGQAPQGVEGVNWRPSRIG